MTDVQATTERGLGYVVDMFVTAHTDQLRYVNGIGWHVWRDNRWAEDHRQTASALVQAFIADWWRRALGDKALGRLLTKANDRIDYVLRLASARTEFALCADDLDAQPYLLNTTTGTYDLLLGESRPASQSDHITKVTGCGIDNRTEAASGFQSFLARVLPDPEVRGFVQRYLGMALFGAVREHRLAIFCGSGANGKSTLLDVVQAALGEYADGTDPELLLDRSSSSGQFKLRGLRLAVTSESDQGRKLAAATVKRLTGGDRITARALYRDFVTFAPSHTLVMVTNHRPVVDSEDDAIWRRLLVVPFDVTIPEAEQDPELADKLRAELPGVLAWVVAGYRVYVALGGLAPPLAVQVATRGYRAESDALARFVEEGCSTGSDALTVRSATLFARWQEWCRANGEEAGSAHRFAPALERHGYFRKSTRDGVVWHGLSLNSGSGGAS